MTSVYKIIGIIGGMGSHAGIDLYEKLLSHTNAEKDQDYPSVVLMSFPQIITDRSLFLQGYVKTNPAYAIAEIVRKLAQAGAEVLGIACNTAYSPGIHEVILKEIEVLDKPVKLIHMPYETRDFLCQEFPKTTRVGIIATSGTYYSGIYQNRLEEMGLKVILPDEKFQEDIIHQMIYHPIYGIKANPTSLNRFITERIEASMNFFSKQNAEVVILACTELSLVFKKPIKRNIVLIDSAWVLSKAMHREALSQPKQAKNQPDLTSF